MDEMSTGGAKRAVLVEAVLRIVAEHGFDHVSVRQVASAAGVSIGTVQHYFPTKDEMLAAAFAEVARRVRARLAAVTLGDDLRTNLSVVLRELLPLDDDRTVEARIQVAFAAAAANSPSLSEIQHAVLTEIRQGLAEALAAGWPGSSPARCALAAHLLIALVDGLALHAVSAGDWLDERAQAGALDLALDALLGPDADDA